MKLPTKQIIKYLYLAKSAATPESLALLVIGVTVVAVTINTSTVIMKNYELERKVRIAEQKVEIAEIELDTQKLQNEYYKTDAFLEIAARRQLSKAAPGEKLIIVPKSVARSYISRPIESPETSAANPTISSNFDKWLQFVRGDLVE